MASEEESWFRTSRSLRKENDPLAPRAGDYGRTLMSINDRQPAEHVQNPEVEQRRHKDLRAALRTLRDVMKAVIEDLERVGFLTEEFFEEMGGEKKSDDDPHDPCKHPKNFVDWMRCYQQNQTQLTRWCYETEIYWTWARSALHGITSRLGHVEWDLYEYARTDTGGGGGPHDLASHTDVDAGMSPGAGHYLCYDNPAGEWTSSTIGIGELDDVADAVTPTSGHYLCGDGAEWINSAINMPDLGDTNFAGLGSGDYMEYDGADWINKDFDTEVRTNRLDQMANPTSNLDFDGNRITDAGDPVGAQDYVTKNWIDGTDGQALSGTYTPTTSNSSNLDGATPPTLIGTWKWAKVGGVLFVSGNFTADATSSPAQTSFEATLPAAVTITTFGLGTPDEVAGTVGDDGTRSKGGRVSAVAGTKRIKIEWRSQATSANDFSFHCMVEL